MTLSKLALSAFLAIASLSAPAYADLKDNTCKTVESLMEGAVGYEISPYKGIPGTTFVLFPASKMLFIFKTKFSCTYEVRQLPDPHSRELIGLLFSGRQS